MTTQVEPTAQVLASCALLRFHQNLFDLTINTKQKRLKHIQQILNNNITMQNEAYYKQIQHIPISP